MLLTSMMKMFETTGRRVRLFWDTLKCDESEKRLSIDMMADLSRDQRISKWPVLSQSRTMGWIDDQGRRIEFGLPCMPVIMLGTRSAGALFDGLFGCAGWISFLLGFITFMRARADDSFAIREADNAGVVTKCFIKEMRTKGCKFYHYFACGLHQCNLGIGLVCKAWLKSRIAAQYAYAQLLRSGNYWLRFLLCVDPWLLVAFDVEKRPPSDLAYFVSDVSVCCFLCDCFHVVCRR